MVFRKFLLEFYVVVLLKEPDPEGFPEFFEFAVVRNEREPFRRETMEEEFEVQIVREMDIILHLYLDLWGIHLGYFLEYLDDGIIFMDYTSFFIHIGRLCSGVYGQWGLF